MNVQNTQQPLSCFGFPSEQELSATHEKYKVDIVSRIMSIFGNTIKANPNYSEYQFTFPNQLREHICQGIEKEFKGQTIYRCTISLLTEQYIQQTRVFISVFQPFEVKKLCTVDHETICIDHGNIKETCPSMVYNYNAKYYD